MEQHLDKFNNEIQLEDTIIFTRSTDGRMLIGVIFAQTNKFFKVRTLTEKESEALPTTCYNVSSWHSSYEKIAKNGEIIIAQKGNKKLQLI